MKEDSAVNYFKKNKHLGIGFALSKINAEAVNILSGKIP